MVNTLGQQDFLWNIRMLIVELLHIRHKVIGRIAEVLHDIDRALNDLSRTNVKYLYTQPPFVGVVSKDVPVDLVDNRDLLVLHHTLDMKNEVAKLLRTFKV